MKKKIILFLIIVLIIFCIIFIKNNYKNFKKGNNINIKSADKITEYILNIENYEAEATITVQSNKTTNKYKVKQKYKKENNVYEQEVLEPENIKGLTITYDGKNLEVKNTKLNLSKIYENYMYVGSNDLSLTSFIEEFKENEGKTYEDNGNVIMETSVKNGNKYRANKKLYINKKSEKITKLEVQDINKNTLIYILYNEIELNNN